MKKRLFLILTLSLLAVGLALPPWHGQRRALSPSDTPWRPRFTG